MSSGRSHSDADLEAWQITQFPHSSMTPGLRGSRGFVRVAMVPHAATTCGSWLASDGGESVNTSGNDIAPSRGKLAPTNAAIAPPLWELACQRWRWVSQYIRR